MGKTSRIQKYIIAFETMPEGCYTIEKYAKEILKADFSWEQLVSIGEKIALIANQNKIQAKFVRHKKYNAIRYYDKIFLDSTFMEVLVKLNK